MKRGGLQTGEAGLVEARGTPEGETAKNEQGQERCCQKRGWPPMDGHLRDSRHSCKEYKDGGGGGNKQPVQDAARGCGLTYCLAPVHAGFDIVCGDAVSAALPLSRFFPAGLFSSGYGREGNGADS